MGSNLTHWNIAQLRTFLGKMKVYEKNANSIHNAYSIQKIEKLPCSKQFLGKVDRNNAVAIGKSSMKWI